MRMHDVEGRKYFYFFCGGRGGVYGVVYTDHYGSISPFLVPASRFARAGLRSCLGFRVLECRYRFREGPST